MRGSLPKRGISITEMIVIFSCILFCILFYGPFLYPIFVHRYPSDATRCLDNMKQLATACQMYAQDNNEMLPFAIGWGGALGTTGKVFDCPKTAYKGTAMAPDYMYVAAFFHNKHGLLSKRKLGDIKDPSLAPMLVELANPGKAGQTSYVSDAIEVSPGKYVYDPKVALYNKIDRTRHNRGSNVAYVDGHVGYLKAKEFTDSLLLNSIPVQKSIIKR